MKTLASQPSAAEEMPAAAQRFRAWWVWSGYLGIVAAAELAAGVSPVLTMALDLVLACGLPLHAALAPPRQRPLLLALALAPLVRVVGLALPLARLPLPVWSGLAALTLLVAGGVAARRCGLDRRELALRRGLLVQQVGIGLLGMPIGVLAYLLVPPVFLVEPGMEPALLVVAALALVGGGATIEFLFRGVLQGAAIRCLGHWGVLYTAGVYAALHLSDRSPGNLVLALGLGLGFGWLVQRTGSLLGVGLAHSLLALVAYLVLPWLFLPPTSGVPPSVPAAPGTPLPAVTAPAALTTPVAPVVLPTAAMPEFGSEEPVQAPTTEVGPAPAPGEPTEPYTVQPGDTLFSIAAIRGTTVNELVALNDLTDPDLLLPGQVLRVPRLAPGE